MACPRSNVSSYACPKSQDEWNRRDSEVSTASSLSTQFFQSLSSDERIDRRVSSGSIQIQGKLELKSSQSIDSEWGQSTKVYCPEPTPPSRGIDCSSCLDCLRPSGAGNVTKCFDLFSSCKKEDGSSSETEALLQYEDVDMDTYEQRRLFESSNISTRNYGAITEYEFTDGRSTSTGSGNRGGRFCVIS